MTTTRSKNNFFFSLQATGNLELWYQKTNPPPFHLAVLTLQACIDNIHTTGHRESSIFVSIIHRNGRRISCEISSTINIYWTTNRRDKTETQRTFSRRRGPGSMNTVNEHVRRIWDSDNFHLMQSNQVVWLVFLGKMERSLDGYKSAGFGKHVCLQQHVWRLQMPHGSILQTSKPQRRSLLRDGERNRGKKEN